MGIGRGHLCLRSGETGMEERLMSRASGSLCEQRRLFSERAVDTNLILTLC
jgi:hypothetical protein